MHHEILLEAIVSFEHSLVLVAYYHAHLMIRLADVELGKKFSIDKSFYYFWNSVIMGISPKL